MKNYTKILIGCLLAIYLQSCSLQKEQDAVPFVLTDIGMNSQNLDPLSAGSYKICQKYYTYNNQIGIEGIITFPMDSYEYCKPEGTFPLVLIMHADGATYEDYGPLANHLTKQGFVTVCIRRINEGTNKENVDQIFETTLDYLYNKSIVKGHLTNQVGVVGHSAGGYGSIANIDVFSKNGLQVKALILMAPALLKNNIYDLNGLVDSFLGITVVSDSDPNTAGNKQAGTVMPSVFRAYDNTGFVESSYSKLAVEKDFIFVDAYRTGANKNMGLSNKVNHYFQNEPFNLAYVNAYLQLHLKGNPYYARYFKNQQIPTSLANDANIMGIYPQHMDKQKFVVANFENYSKTKHYLGDIQIYSTLKNVQAANSWEIDNYSPHQTSFLKFDVDRTGQLAYTPAFIKFNFATFVNVNSYKYLSFRITQVYDPVKNNTGTEKDISITLKANGITQSVKLSQVAKKLHFPIKSSVVNQLGNYESTKNAMRSYIIPLSAFSNLNKSLLQGITFDFSLNSGSKTTYELDDIEFYN